VDLSARTDLTNLVSLIKGNSVALKAGRDIALTSTSASENHGATWGSHISGVSRVDAGNLSMQAGRDVTLTAAQVAAKDGVRVQAGRDINLATLEESHGESLVLNRKNRHDLATSKEIGSSIDAGGNVTLIAGQDVNARVADVTAGGQLAVGAGRDINLTAGVQSGSAYDETHYKTRGFLSSKTTHTKTASDWTDAKGSNFMGDTVALMAARDLTVQGSNVVGDHDVMLTANRDLTIEAAAESYKDYQYEKVTKSGLGGGGGFNIGYSKQARTDWMKGESGGYSSSTVGSVGGNVVIDAGRNVGVFASNVLAQDGDISIAGRDVAIVAGVGEARQHEYHELKQSGLTIGMAGGVLGAAQQIHGTLKQAGEAKSGRLAAVKVGQAAYQAVQAERTMDAAKGSEATTAQKEAASAQIQISLSSSKSASETKRTQETAFESSIMAGGNVSIAALGEKGVAGSGNLSIVGSDVTGKNVLLASTNDLYLLSQAQTSTETSTNKNSGWKVGVGIGVSDSGSGGGINIFASGYAGKGNAHGNGTTYQETQISARDNLTLISGRDTVLMGAQARADSIRADIGRNLTIASQQDTDRYNAKQSQVNAGGSFSFGSMTGSAYIGASIGKTKSNYDSVIEQSGLYAGTGGFDIYVGKHTQLDGAVIASDAEAAKNKLSTETFGFTDLENKAAYKSTTAGVNLGMSGAFDVANKGGANGIGPSGLSFGHTSGSDSGTTYAAIAPGAIEVRSEKETGRDSTAGLSRDTAGANGSIGQIFDKDKVREQLEFQQAFGQLGMQIAGDVLNDLKKDDPDLWGEGEAGAIAMHAAIAGIGAALGGGNVAGAIAGTIAGDLASNLVQDQIALAVADLPVELRSQVYKVITNVVASAAGGLAGGLSGAGGAAASNMFNRQLHPSETEWIEKNAKLYASRKGIAEEDALKQLAAQAYRQVQTGAEGAWDAEAQAFLKQAHGMLPDGGYMFYAPPFQRNDSAMYAENLPMLADFYVKNGLQFPAEGKVVDAATRNAQSLNLMSNLTFTAGGVSAALALAGLPPTLISWAFANPADAVTIGVISAETAAAIQSGAVLPTSVLAGPRNAPGKVLGAKSPLNTLRGVPGRVQSRINLANEGMEHLVSRHLSGKVNASQFSIGEPELRGLLQSKAVVSTPVTRIVESADGVRYVREVDVQHIIGTDKFSGGGATSIMTVMTDRFGNLVTAFPGVMK
jgi:filamentous hemagglutinin